MTTPSPPLSSLSDPVSLSRLQILLVPINTSTSSISNPTYAHWSSLIKRHTVLRGDELARPLPPAPGHNRGATSTARTRFFPASSSTSISRGGASNHVHLGYPTHPPARHLSNLSLLRVSAFPLVVLGIAAEEESAQGYTVNGDEDDGDIGGASASTSASRSNAQDTPAYEEILEETLGGLFPPTSPFPLVKRLIVVPKDAPTSRTPTSSPKKNGTSSRGEANSARGKGKAGVDVVHAPTEGVEGWLGRLLGEVVGDVLAELGELATALETPTGLKTLSSTLLPSLTSTLPHPRLDTLFPGQSNGSTPTLDHPRSRSTTPVSIPHSHFVDTLSSHSGMGISLTRALTPGGRPMSVGPPSLPPIQTKALAPTPPPAPPSASSNPFRRSTALSSPFTRSTSSASLATTAATNSAALTNGTGTRYTSAPLSGLAGGRLLKLLGDMYLLAGMYSDAIKCFDDGAERCRTVGDVLWEALAREGRAVAGIGEAWEGRDGSNMTQAFSNSPIPVEVLSHYLSALACLARAPLPYPPTILSPSPQAVSGSISFAGPSAGVPGSVGTGEGLLAYLHTGLALRISHFLLIIWAAGGWGSVALSSLLSHTLPRSFPPPLSTEEVRDPTSRRKRKRTLGLLGSKSLLSRASIYDHAGSALGPHHRAMTKMEQLAVHVEVAWLARWLDLPRKEAGVTREVVKRIGMMVVEAREENRRHQAAGFSKRHTMSSADPGSAISASVGLGLGMAVPTQAVAVRRRESTEGNGGVMSLFERALSLMGLDLLDFASDEPASRKEEETIPLNRFGWPEIQVEMMKEGIAVAEALPDHAAMVRFCTTALNVLHRHLNPQSQGHVAKMFPAALNVLRRRGLEMGELPWWVPGKLVLSLEVASLPANRLPLEHSSEEIKAKEGMRDPFLYNPRLKAAEAGKTVIVANEQTEVFITMQNPFAFDLDIQDISLITTGVSFITNPHPIALAPGNFQTIRLAGVASTPGSLEIRGVKLRLQDGSSTEVLLPLISDKERSKRDKRKSRVIADASKSKRQGMEARWSMVSASSGGGNEERRGADPKEKWLECKVVEEQPVVWIKKTSLTHGTVMLYNGETSTIKITLENSSSTPVDFVKLSFEDSASRAAAAALSEGELSGERAYELEWDMINRPVFTWNGETDVSIPPGQRATLSITCLGKVGCTDGSVRIDYGYLRRSSTDLPKTFQTRQITFPVLFTVYHTLEAHSLDLVKVLPSDPTQNRQKTHRLAVPPAMSRKSSGAYTPRGGSFPSVGDALAREQLSSTMDGKHALLALSISNSYGVPFELSLSRRTPTSGHEQAEWEEGEVTTTRLVPPGATERLILPVPRLSIPAEELAQPIPKLSDRQYVVEKLKKTAEQVRADRELFWYRERLLSSLEATWIEPGSRRSGTLSLRDQDVTLVHLDALKVDELDIELNVVSRTGDRCIATEFVDVIVKITNRLERPFRPYIKLEPLPSSSFDTSWTCLPQQTPRRPQSTLPVALRNIVFDGSREQTLGQLQPGEEARMSVGAVFLAEGLFGFRVAVEEVEVGRKRELEQGQGQVQPPPRVRFSEVLQVKVEKG